MYVYDLWIVFEDIIQTPDRENHGLQETPLHVEYVSLSSHSKEKWDIELH
jgi:hypothetical protein